MTAEPRPTETVGELLRGAAEAVPEVTALATPNERVSYGELLSRAGRLAATLGRGGVVPGDRVAIWLANGVDWLVGYWGATLAGAVVVPLGTRHPPAEIARLVRHSQAAALLTSDRFGEIDATLRLAEVLAEVEGDLARVVARFAGERVDRRGVIAWDDAIAASGGAPEAAGLRGALSAAEDPDAIHLIQYTSGTTGEPKGAMLSHRGLVRSARIHAAAWGLGPAEAVLVPNPFSHILGLVYGCLMPAAVGATSLTLPVFDVEAALALAAVERAVALTGAPTHLQMMVEHPNLEEFDLGSLRLAMTGGAPISARWARRVVDGLGLEALVNGYGMSEAGSVAQTAPGEPVAIAAATVGDPMEGLEVRVVDPGTFEAVEPGGTGELWIRGASVMKGYYGAPELSRAALTDDGWLRTGDLVSRDAAGRLRFVNRLREMFTVGGFNVYPARVEAALREHSEVSEAVVLALSDERLGARPQAVVRLGHGGPVPEDLTSFCRQRLADYEVPERFVVVGEMPINAAGKIDRRRLLERLAADHGAAERHPAAAAETGAGDSGSSGDAETASGCAPPEPTFGSYFVAAYPPFSQWDEASCATFERALESAPAAGSAPPGLYCHVPFCVERCRYCYYLSHSGRQIERIDAYLEGVVAELEILARRPVFAGRALDFVYFGGGTPSLLSTTRLQRLLPALAEIWSWSAAREVTFECAPRSVTAEKMLALRAAGVTRLSLGVQQLDDEILRRNGRVHLVADVERAYEQIRRAGFPVVNLDLMVGLVGETEETFWRSLERIVGMEPESITLYQMEIPLNTPLWEEMQGGGSVDPPASWEVKHDRLERAFEWLKQRGYGAISAYTAVRDPERHGFVYQSAQYQGADLVGIGVASFSYLQGVHHQNETRLGAYLSALEAGRLPLGRAHALDDEERLVRELVLQLKLGRVDPSCFRAKFGVDLLERFRDPLGRFQNLGWLRCDAQAIELTATGIPRADRMLPEFYLAGHREVRYS